MPSAPKKPTAASAPKAPKKPTSKSKTGNSACSQAASNWQLAIRGKEPIAADTYKTLAKCRGLTRAAKAADGRAAAGYNLSDQGAAAIKGRLQSRFDRDLITEKSRQAKVKELLAARAAKQAAAKPAATATPLPPRTADTMSEAIALSSPNGKMSNRSRLAANKRIGAALFGPNGMPVPQAKQPSEIESLRRNATELRDLASRGMKPRSHIKTALQLEQKANELENAKDVSAVASKFYPMWGDVVKSGDTVARSTSTGMGSERVKLYRGKSDSYRFMGYGSFDELTNPSRNEKATFLVKERSERPISEADRKKAMLIAKRVTKAPSRKAAKQAAPVAKPAAAPAPAKFSRNGELAPGRGTPERSAKAAQLGRYRQILPSVDGSATQPRLFQTGPNKTQHLVATVRSSTKYGLMRQRATANKERISNNFGIGYITGSGDKRHHNTDFRWRTLSDQNRGKSAVKSRIDDLREKRADRPTDPTEARRSSPFELRQIQERAATRVEPAPAKFSRNGQMAPGRGQDDPSYGNRALRVHDKAHARAKVLMRGVDGTRSTRWEQQQQRSNELRLTVENLKPAVIRKIQKDIDAERSAIAAYDAKQAASAPKPKAKPAPVQASTRNPMFRPVGKLARGSKPRQKAVKGQIAELTRKREIRAAAAGTIPISYKSSVPKGFTAELRPGSDAGKNILIAIKPVSKSFGIQARDKKTQFGVVHSESGKSLTWKNLTSKDATRGAKAADYLTRRAERETSVKGIDALLKKPKYIRTLVQFFDRKAIR